MPLKYKMEKNTKVVLIFIGAIVLLLVIMVYLSTDRNPGIAEVEKGINPAKGNPNSQITIIEFGDFKCPACKAAHPVINEILNEYNVSLYYRNFPLPMHGEISFLSAEAAECANEQNKFWQYHEILFENQDILNKENLKLYAKEIDLNEQQFNNCLDTEKYKNEVEKDIKDAKDLGVQGTPTFFINGKKVLGADKEKIKQIIEEAI